MFFVRVCQKLTLFFINLVYTNNTQQTHDRGIQTTNGTSRTNDDVHNSISMDALTKTILDTPHLQRLRGLKQLGVSEMVYTTTTHSRFEHSLGVSYLCQVILEGIRNRQPLLEIRAKDIACVKLAGLLHDLGHGPFSHVYDGDFRHEHELDDFRFGFFALSFV